MSETMYNILVGLVFIIWILTMIAIIGRAFYHIVMDILKYLKKRKEEKHHD